ncbi:hypothetical protein H5410_050031 [Solanum commersonii]|uniref:Uncharacterized protein n=1 Tax=Solanum commersonii TaxID=4109 RepID=A0A9J5WWF4_SOLCO|nr:hypothetical protein H5410_050031 [Solanum commersonii]
MFAEKEVLKFEKEGLDVVTLCYGLVGGHTFLPYIPSTSAMFLSVFTQEEKLCNIIKFLEKLNGKFPIVNIEDEPEDLNLRYLNDPKREIKWGSKKLIEKGFVYKYGMKELLDDCVKSARKNGIL